MKLGKHLLLALSTAPEVLFALGIYAAWLYRPDIFSFVGEKLKADQDVWKYLNALPVALIAVCFKSAAKIRAPLDVTLNKKLYEWPDYGLLVTRVNIALTIATVAATIQISLWMFGKQLQNDLIGLVYLISTAVLLITTIQLILASMKIGELLTEHA